MEREAERTALRRLREAQKAYDQAFTAQRELLAKPGVPEADLASGEVALAQAAKALRDAGTALRLARRQGVPQSEESR